jgi:hypothetical protein
VSRASRAVVPRGKVCCPLVGAACDCTDRRWSVAAVGAALCTLGDLLSAASDACCF